MFSSRKTHNKSRKVIRKFWKRTRKSLRKGWKHIRKGWQRFCQSPRGQLVKDVLINVIANLIATWIIYVISVWLTK